MKSINTKLEVRNFLITTGIMFCSVLSYGSWLVKNMEHELVSKSRKHEIEHKIYQAKIEQVSESLISNQIRQKYRVVEHQNDKRGERRGK